MNHDAHPAPQFAAICLAAVMTLATLLGVGQLADHSHTHVQLTQASGQSAKA